ncbi:MAG: FKBP-type peptidyl-prolyl cis-trans isomerase [Bacteroidales bacterium]|nr:FKBP-type peptidyl-prolyl cis-trans isomerase [Bacteroidales bacterium]
MKKLLTATLAATLLILATTACNNNTEKVVLQNENDTLSWAMGMSLAQTAQNFNFNQDLVQQAFESALSGQQQPLDQETYQAACQYIAFLAQQNAQQQAQASAQNADKLQEECFAKLIATNKNITKAPEGYYYEVLQQGHGPNAKVGQRVSFDFKGSNMLTGDIIEQTYGHRDPIIHNLDTPMFQGLVLGMQRMNAGSKYRFYFPYTLVQGANGVPQYTPVVYEIELHEIFLD